MDLGRAHKWIGVLPHIQAPRMDGSEWDDISRFFAEHGMSFGILYSEAFGSLYTVGCAPDVHCGDQVILQVRVKVDPAGAVAEEPSVDAGYDSCP